MVPPLTRRVDRGGRVTRSPHRRRRFVAARSERGSTSRFTFDGSHNNDAVWSPDGAEVVFAGRSDGVPNLHYKPTASGSETDEPLLPRLTAKSRPIGVRWSSTSCSKRPIRRREPTSGSFRCRIGDHLHICRQSLSNGAGGFPRMGTGSPMCRMRRDGTRCLSDRFLRRAGSGRSLNRWRCGTTVAPRREGLFYVSADGTFKSVTLGTKPRFDPGPPRSLFTAESATRITRSHATASGSC